MRAALLLLAVVAVARAAPDDPGATGRFAAAETTLALHDASRGRTLPTLVWYPAEGEAADAPPRRGPFRLVLLAHGHCGFARNYEYLGRHLARHGFVVAAPDFPGFSRSACQAGESIGDLATDPPRDLAYLHALLRDRRGAAAGRVPRVRGAVAGLVGHSLGGLVVLNAAAADPGFRAVAALAPAAASAQAGALAAARPRPAVLVAAGTDDTTVPFAASTAFFALLEPPAYLVGIAGGTHSGFTDVDARLAPEALARQQALTARYTSAFFARHLAGRRAFRRVLTPEDAAAQGADVDLTVRLR